MIAILVKDVVYIVHVDQVKTNRRYMTMRIQGGKVWNYIIFNDIDLKNTYAFKKCFKSYLLKIHAVNFKWYE